MLLKMKTSPTIKASMLLLMNLMMLFFCTLFAFSKNMLWMLEINLLNLNSLDISTPMILDKTSLIFSMTVVMISLSVMLFSTSYMGSEKNLEYFVILVMLFVLSMNILIFIPNLITLLLGWDGLGLTSYLLVIYYSNSKSLSAGMITALTNRIGDALLILAISWAMMSGHWNFSFSAFSINIFITFSIMLAAMTKSAQMPFSAWLPAAMAAPTPVSALVHSSTLVTAGIYLIIRFFPTLSEFLMIKFLCFFVGTLTCTMASMAAISENDLKKIIALSTLSQLGIMMIALGLEQPSLAFFHLITHALFKALLFICAGTIIHTVNNNQDIRLMGNLESISPITMVMLNTANLSLCGIPFLAGFYSKDAIIETFFMTSMPITTSIIMMSSVCLTSAYTMRLSLLTLWNPTKNQMFSQSCSKVTYLAYMILIFGAITGGALMNWFLTPIKYSPNLPKMLKMLTLSLILFFAIFMFLSNNSKLSKISSNFLSSMWFLTLLSSASVNNPVMKLSKMTLIQEATWMEKISGKGISLTLMNTTKYAEHTNKMTLSELLTSMSFFLAATLVMKIMFF